MNSGFATFHPLVSAIYLSGLLVFIMWLSHPLYLLTALCSVLLLMVLGDGGAALKQSWRGSLLLGAVVLVMNPFFSSRGATILFYVFDRPVTMESLLYGVIFALMLITMLLTFQAGRQIFSTDKFLYLTGSLLPRTAFMLVMVIRLIPLLQRRLKEISVVSKTLGESPDRTRKEKIRSAMRHLNTLLVWTLEESLHTAVSMRASGYGTGPRSSSIPYHMDARGWRMLLLMLFLGGGVIVGGWMGAGRISFYPVIEGMTVSISHFMAFAVWCALPILTYSMEMIQWQTISWNR